MTETLERTGQLSEAYKDMLNELKSIASNDLAQRVYTIEAKVLFINRKVYGGNQYVKVQGDLDGHHLQLIVPVEISSTLEPNSNYQFTGTFQITSQPQYGLFQFKVDRANFLYNGQQIKEQVIKEIYEKGYLDKYRYDFSQLNGKNECKVGLVTSPQSQVIADVEEVFRYHKNISTAK